MKFLILALALIPTLVFADFRIGRVRTGATAQMNVLRATGAYAGVKKVKIGALYEDGAGLVGYTLELDGQPVSLVRGGKEVTTSCGKEMRMSLGSPGLASTGDIVAGLTVNDTTTATCRRRIDYKWEARLETTNIQTHESSVLDLGGNPEFLMMTM